MKYYAGIGSRETPAAALELMERAAAIFACEGWTLRSGGAQGADQAFERGCDLVGGLKQIFLPWRGFEDNLSPFYEPTREASVIAASFHPRWETLSQGARRLHARNAHQVLGANLREPVEFIICWTPKGSGSGGTGQALRIARSHNIPVIDLGFAIEK